MENYIVVLLGQSRLGTSFFATDTFQMIQSF